MSKQSVAKSNTQLIIGIAIVVVIAIGVLAASGMLSRALVGPATVTTQILNNAGTDITNTNVAANTLVKDKATVTGDVGTPAGKVLFELFAGSKDCTGLHTDSSAILVDGMATSSLVATSIGGLSYLVVYVPDDGSPYGQTTGTCESINVIAPNPVESNTRTQIINKFNLNDITYSTVQTNTLIFDKATVSGSAGTPTGSVTFERRTTFECFGAAAGPATTQVVALVSGVATSSLFNAATQGVISYDAVYSPTGGVYLTSTSACERIFVETTGTQGCTPGFWKNNALTVGAWRTFAPSTLLKTVFNNLPASVGSATFVQALDFQGGNTLEDAKKILLKSAVAALLNAASTGVDYAFTSSQIISLTNAALLSTDRNAIIAQYNAFDKANNAKAPICK